MITTDKCYENREWLHAYREEDAMGGHDPYSASKGCAELAIASYRRSFFAGTLRAGHTGAPVALASARAGNVIGGGDWAENRIVPDCVRALLARRPIPVRNRTSTRPWQHVLEPLSGYLLLGQQMMLALGSHAAADLERLCAPFNFGPGLQSNRTVADLVEEVLRLWPGTWMDQSDPHALHEASRLNLTIDKAYHLLHWGPVWSFAETIAATVAWYRQTAESPGNDPGACADLTRGQIAAYAQAARALGLAWAAQPPAK
jgi:CDP-glucose 4,6-dehydratase